MKNGLVILLLWQESMLMRGKILNIKKCVDISLIQFFFQIKRNAWIVMNAMTLQIHVIAQLKCVSTPLVDSNANAPLFTSVLHRDASPAFLTNVKTKNRVGQTKNV